MAHAEDIYWPGGPPIHNIMMGFCGRPGEDPKTWKQFGPEANRLYVLCRQR